MKNNQFLALTYAGQYVDGNLLYKGIYYTNMPTLYRLDTTITDIIKNLVMFTDLKLEDELTKNLYQCVLKKVEINFVE